MTPLIAIAAAASASAETGHDLAGPSLHFSHPLVAESPMPDTKLRVDYRWQNEVDARRQSIFGEAEYAFARWVSAVVEGPYTFLDPEGQPSSSHLDNLEIGTKLASYAFEEQGLLLGGGLEIGLPTGDGEGIGFHTGVELEPFLDLGWERGPFQAVGFVRFGVPIGNEGAEELDFEFLWNVSFRYAFVPRLEGFVELDGERVVGGGEDGRSVVNITPSLKLAPIRSLPDLRVGAGVSLPLTRDREFEVRAIGVVFYHF